jgi:hypothetical protein
MLLDAFDQDNGMLRRREAAKDVLADSANCS